MTEEEMKWVEAIITMVYPESATEEQIKEAEEIVSNDPVLSKFFTKND